MIVKDKHLTTIWYDNSSDKIKIIDQRLLPHEIKFVELNTLQDVCFAIQDMQVRGAPLIGITAAYGMYIAARENSDTNYLKDASIKLKNTRPTAVNLSWAIDYIFSNIKNLDKDNLLNAILDLANQMRLDDIECCEAIGENGLKLIQKLYEKKQSTINILTHCNAGWLATVDWGTALSPIYKAKRNDIPLHVWVDETRPRNQGFNLTSWELINENIPNTLIVDNVGGHLMQHNKVDLCITGTDRTSSNGDVCNKIGTYLKALAANDNKIPFYVAAPISSIDFEISNGLLSIPIEERSPDEVSYIEGKDEFNKISKVKIIPENAKCINYAFDVTPAKYITKLITEKGIVEPNKDSIITLK
mgnify:FL=1